MLLSPTSLAMAALAHKPAALVIYVGNDLGAPTELHRFEAWLGCPVKGVSVHSGQANWADWQGSIGYALSLWNGSGRQLYWSVPLIPEGAILAEAARGAYDARYVAAAKVILAGTFGGDVIPVRTGWEFNQDYMPWSARGQERDFADGYRHFVRAFRTVSNRFRFEWAPAIGGNSDPARAYPGDNYVDVVGIDAYYNIRWDSSDAGDAWRTNVIRPYGFGWLEAFAATHGKPTAYGEWGVMSPGSGPYVQQAALWYAGHRVAYQSYWNSDSSFPGKLNTGRLPEPGMVYRKAFSTCRRTG